MEGDLLTIVNSKNLTVMEMDAMPGEATIAAAIAALPTILEHAGEMYAAQESGDLAAFDTAIFRLLRVYNGLLSTVEHAPLSGAQ